MQEHWSLVHVGGRASVKGDKIDYSFVDNQPQTGDGYQPKNWGVPVRLHDLG